MPDLRRVLLDYDLGLLQLIAELWGLELASGSQREAQEELAGLLLYPEAVTEVIEALPPEARAALEALAREGRQPIAQFTRRYGELRAMGPARRDRERPWENGASVTETLWYRALIGRAFFDDGRGPVEHLFIPDDLRPLIYVGPEVAAPTAAPPGEPAAEPAAHTGMASAAAHDAVTLLAYLQVVTVRLDDGALPARHREALRRFLLRPAALDLLLHLLQALGLVQALPNGLLKLDPDQAQPFLHSAESERLRQMAEAWRASRDWNELLQLPGLLFEGQAWSNDPRSARQAILALLEAVPTLQWWSLESFVAAVKDRQPDFQRPAGDYDSWYIRDAATQTYLRGFAHWDRVDGALVRHLILYPLHWLGLVDLSEDGAAFRLTAFGEAFLGRSGWLEPETGVPVRFNAEGLFRFPSEGSAHDRFQLARISDWLPPEGADYLYRLTPASLARAVQKGITVPRILDFLQRMAGAKEVEARAEWTALSGALRRWETRGGEVVLREAVVLKLSSADLLELLRGTPAVRDYLGESVGPTAVLVKKEHHAALRAALAQIGILTDE